MRQQLNKAIVRVTNSSKETLGTGFFVDHDLIVTCAHVLEKANATSGGLAKPGDTVQVELLFDQSTKAIKTQVLQEGYSPSDCYNIAFLAVGDKLSGMEVARLDGHANCKDHPYETIGFVNSTASTQHWEYGVIQGRVDADEQQGNLLQLSGDGDKFILSGAPVLDKATNRVVGMNFCREDSNTGNLTYAIPAEYLRTSLKEIQKKRKKPPFPFRPLFDNWRRNQNEPKQTRLPVPNNQTTNANPQSQPQPTTRLPHKGPWIIVHLLGPGLLIAAFVGLLINTGLYQLFYDNLPGNYQYSISPKGWIFSALMIFICFSGLLALDEKISKTNIFYMPAYRAGLVGTIVIMFITLILLTLVQSCQLPAVRFYVNEEKQAPPGETFVTTPGAEVMVRAFDGYNASNSLFCTWHVLDPAIQIVNWRDCSITFRAPVIPGTTLISVDTEIQPRSVNCNNQSVNFLLFQTKLPGTTGQ